MESNRFRSLQRKTRRRATGFTLIELMIATLVLMIGLVAVSQLVPLTINRNLLNRNDTKATIVAEQVLDQILSLKIDATTTTVTVDGQPFPIQIGGPAAGATGSAIVVGAGGQVALDFSVPAVAGYNFLLVDPANPSSPPIEVRLGVITSRAGGGPVSKRFAVGAWRRDQNIPVGANNVFLPVTFDGFVQR